MYLKSNRVAKFLVCFASDLASWWNASCKTGMPQEMYVWANIFSWSSVQRLRANVRLRYYAAIKTLILSKQQQIKSTKQDFCDHNELKLVAVKILQCDLVNVFFGGVCVGCVRSEDKHHAQIPFSTSVTNRKCIGCLAFYLLNWWLIKSTYFFCLSWGIVHFNC